MTRKTLALCSLSLLTFAAASTGTAIAEMDTETQPPEFQGRVEVTATRIQQEPERVPQSITVVTGDDLRAWGATDLTSALAFVEGVEISPGRDNGPRSSVPAFWGLRELDAVRRV